MPESDDTQVSYPNIDPNVKNYVNKKISEENTSKTRLWAQLGFVLIPIVISFFVWVANVDKRVSILEQKQESYQEMKDDIKVIKEQLQKLNLKLARAGIGEEE